MERLTSVQIEFLKIVGSFLHDIPYQLPENFKELPELYKLAEAHNLSAAVYEVIRNDQILKKSEWKDFNLLWKRRVIRSIWLQTQRTDGFLNIYRSLKKAGIKSLVVKGIVCRHLYEKSDYRPSGDEDIVIRRDLMEKADEIFLSEGFLAKNQEPDRLKQQTIAYLHPINGTYVEVQPELFEEQVAILNNLNKDFEDMFETCIVERIQGEDIYTLEPTKHFLYIIYHAFKHFIDGGVGIRQVCDMVMMAEHYHDEIDWYYVKKRLKQLHLDEFCKNLGYIAEEYLGFNYGKGKNKEVDYIPLLLDLLDAGVFGQTSDERKGSSGMTMMAVDNARTKDVDGESYLFPSYEYMKVSVPWLEKKPWLLPVAYVVRIIRYLFRSVLIKKSMKNSLQVGVERVELLKKYKIIR